MFRKQNGIGTTIFFGSLFFATSLFTAEASARGVSPYLPLNLAPAIERKIERLLILADKPVMRRPIPAAVVLDALSVACRKDAALCADVRSYLQRYMHDAGLTQLQGEVALTAGDSEQAMPNAHGMAVDSVWQVAASGYYQPNDYMLASVGGVAYQGRATPTGTVFSAGFDWAQLDVGYRDHWLSPLTDSSMLISTQAPTMPSVTLSNYRPISPIGFNYEVFLAEASRQENIAYFDSTTSGRPRLAGLQLGIEPVSGYAVAVNRVMQYGGGARNAGVVSQFFDALFKNTNLPDSSGQSEERGNQVASLTSSLMFNGVVPFAVRAEYAGEDNAYAGHYRLGETDLSLGLDFPHLWQDFDLTYEVSEWQPAWYVHHIYPDGLTNEGHVLGHWFGDARRDQAAIGGYSQMLRIGWLRDGGDYIQAKYRNLKYDLRWVPAGLSAPAYKTLNELGISYSTVWKGHAVNGELLVGRDAFGDSYGRLAASFDLLLTPSRGAGSYVQSSSSEDGTDVFVDIGVHRSTLRKILADYIPNFSLPAETNYHVGFGARRAVSEHADLGARLELDRVDSQALLSLRALDYRYRFNRKFAATAFFGVGRYDVGLPAYGYYWGGGLQLMNIFPKWDLGLDQRHHEKMGRDKVLATDPPPTPVRERMFFDMNGTALYLSRHF